MKRSPARLHAILLASLCAAGCGSRDAEKARALRLLASAALDRPAILATIGEGEKGPVIAPPPGLGMHRPSSAGELEFIFSERGGGVAYVVERDEKLQVVHNGSPGKWYDAVGTVALSPDGRRCAYGALVGGRWRMVVDGREGQPFSAVRMPTFSQDGAHLAYQAMEGDLWHLVVDATVNAGTETRYLTHEFGGDSSRIVFIDSLDGGETGRLAVSDLAFKEQLVVAQNVATMLTSGDGSRVAAVVHEGSRQRVISFGVLKPDPVKAGAPLDGLGGMAFGPDGSLAYLAERSGSRFAVLNDKEEPFGAGEPVGPPVVRPDGKSVGVLVYDAGAVVLRQFFSGSTQSGLRHDQAEGLVYSDDGRLHAFAASRGGRWFVVVNGAEGPPFERVVSPQFSSDGRLVVYRARSAGRRFVVVADGKGRTLSQHPAHESVFPVLFTADGKSVAYGVKDGPQLLWKVVAL